MSVGTRSQAVVLLTVWFGRPQKDEPRPLGPAEWSRLFDWLRTHGLEADALLTHQDLSKLLAGWTDRTVTLDRISALLERAGALGFALEKWQRAGLWVMTRSDPDYPARLRTQLGPAAPPVLFGCGHRPLLDQGGLAVVGSRDAGAEDLAWTRRLGHSVASHGRSVVSGGARGVDEAAMLGALEAEGTAVGVLPDSLLRAAMSAKYRKALMRRSLVLVSPFSPESGFDVGNAMRRNQYIYCLSDGAVIVASAKDKGGTWTGALENLRHGWVPLWVKRQQGAHSGNAAIVERGARWLPEDLSDLQTLMSGKLSSPGVADLFQSYGEAPRQQSGDHLNGSSVADAPLTTGLHGDRLSAHADEPGNQGVSLYDMFLSKASEVCGTDAVTPEVLRTRLELTKTQLNAWLKRAVAEKRLKRLTRPVRYRVAERRQRSLAL